MPRKYLFSDESGDLQFLDNGQASKYFAVGSLVVDQELLIALRTALSRLRDELAWKAQGLDSSYHATTDAQEIRDAVFEVLAKLDFRFDITLLEKRKALPAFTQTNRLSFSTRGFTISNTSLPKRSNRMMKF